ncbi:hypothetical protein [Streptomyces cinereoruber]|uniref:Integrase n=1 Tax=Streptomyces cinereoruber TaxID=67260 RepID=A0ABX6BND9_9ACTN|nr:hypothetical protein [Streptomyces cinereoruber]MBB4160045.1 hypothetical protein [Streptomyces cinereoruber]MBY8818343.1 hypothetical protein [Streptomyces cinereoruber]NIH60983.1 hypothetical protein [Streptomyces cinereoruber]QEV36838.1 hypothetical protein CP977_14910 [Streptomyces cinereoruber]
MAHAEKVFKVRDGRKTKQFTWRARFFEPDGSVGSESGFDTKKAAEDWGREQERLISIGMWVDPRKRSTTFGTFARTFMSTRRKRGRTNGTRWERLESHILPRWEHVPMGAITWFEVDSWQMTMSCEDVTRGHCVSLMSTIMTAAVDAGYLTVNPLFGRRRTRDTSADMAAPKPSKVGTDGTVRPEDVILVAERLGPGRGLHVLATGFLGFRWGEGLGLHRDSVLLTRRQPWGAGEYVCPIIRIVQEYAEYEERGPDGEKLGYRLQLEPTKNDGSTRDVDVPPFLATLLRYHLADWPHPHVFTTPSGKPWRRGNWSRVMRPACDGREEREKRQGVSYRAAWEPILPGLDMRALRGLHDTLQAQIGVKEPLAFEAAGHRRPGIKRHYQRPTPDMRQERLDGLEEVFWRAMGTLEKRTLWGRVDLRKVR